jgi:hypothetical protein
MRANLTVRLGVAGAMAAAMAACVPTPAGRADPTPAPSSGSLATPFSNPSRAVVSPTPSPSFVRPTAQPSPTFLVYEVKPGDSLTSIARLFGTTARSIAYWNRARYPSLDPDSSTYEPNRIVVGWTFQLIPTAVVDEEELPDPTPSPTPAGSPTDASPSPS